MLLQGFETCDLNSGRTARLAGAAASHFLVTYNADIRCRERKGKGGKFVDSRRAQRERGKESYKEECVHVRACMHVCVYQLSAYTYNKACWREGSLPSWT